MDYANPKRSNGTKMSELKLFDDRLFRAICLNCKDVMTFPNLILGLQMLRQLKWHCGRCEVKPEKKSPQELRRKMDVKNEK